MSHGAAGFEACVTASGGGGGTPNPSPELLVSCNVGSPKPKAFKFRRERSQPLALEVVDSSCPKLVCAEPG